MKVMSRHEVYISRNKVSLRGIWAWLFIGLFKTKKMSNIELAIIFLYGVAFGYVLKHWIEYKIKQKEDE